ncbi:hypothetical protein [Uliginosibacterium sediminicola]|uniref:O-antigen/teichoic acid export membrane protein n=1 Tax=Uliginosibacterium sediminicola TaxID=2024550 RepID=A0ABU9YX27_9RHOO
MKPSGILLVLAQRGWQAASGVLTIVLIAHCMSPQLQGWYYSFLSVAALYTLVDLGLSVVLVQHVAHRFVGLHWGAQGEPVGPDAQRFMQLMRWALRRYVFLAVLFAMLLIPGGALFFSQRDDGFSWLAAWLALALSTSLNIVTLPCLAIIEGSGAVREAYAIRFAQGVLGAAACWVVMLAGGQLWAAVMPAAAGLCVVSIVVWRRRPAMLRIVLSGATDAAALAEEIWPLQWRVGLTWLSGYLLTQIYTPILFHFQGAVVAGQMGLSLTIANTLGLLAQSWIARSVPAMGKAAALRDWKTLDAIFRRDLQASMLSFGAGVVVVCCLYALLADSVYLLRVLPFGAMLALLGVVFANHLIGALAAHLRVHLREPLVWVSVAAAFLSVPAAVWAAANQSAASVVGAMLAVQCCLALPLSLWRWHGCKKSLRNP